MNYAKLGKDVNDSYLIIDHNDEKLSVILEFFLKPELISQFKENFESFNFMTSHDKRFKINREADDLIIIRYYHENKSIIDEDNPLEIEINPFILKNIIEELSEHVKESKPEITLVRDKDEYSLYS